MIVAIRNGIFPNWLTSLPEWAKSLALVIAVFFLTACGGDGEKPVPSDPKSGEEGNAASKSTQGLKIVPAIAELSAEAGDDTVEAHFTITNENDTVLKITGLDTTCACLEVKAADTVLEPGESTSIDALFEIGKILGEAEKMILVYTDKKPGRAVFLPVKVKVPPIFTIEPKNINWELNDSKDPKSFRFTTVRENPIKIISVESSRPDMVDVQLKELEKGREYEIVLTPKATNDHVLGFVKITTDLEIVAHRTQMAFFAITDS